MIKKNKKIRLVQTNEGFKCPNCKCFGLKPITIFEDYSGSCGECEGHLTNRYDGIKIYRCRNCYAEFMKDEDTN